MIQIPLTVDPRLDGFSPAGRYCQSLNAGLLVAL